MTKETAQFLLNLLGQVSISAGDPQLEVTTTRIIKARKELQEAFNETPKARS